MTRILTLLDDILSSTSSRTKFPKKNVPRTGRNLKSARRKKEKKEGRGKEGEEEGEGEDDIKEGRERNVKLHNIHMNTTGRIHCRRRNNNCEEELYPTVDPVKPMTTPASVPGLTTI